MLYIFTCLGGQQYTMTANKITSRWRRWTPHRLAQRTCRSGQAFTVWQLLLHVYTVQSKHSLHDLGSSVVLSGWLGRVSRGNVRVSPTGWSRGYRVSTGRRNITRRSHSMIQTPPSKCIHRSKYLPYNQITDYTTVSTNVYVFCSHHPLQTCAVHFLPAIHYLHCGNMHNSRTSYIKHGQEIGISWTLR